MTDGSIVHMVVMKKKAQESPKTEESTRSSTPNPANIGTSNSRPQPPSANRITPPSTSTLNPIPPPPPLERPFPSSFSSSNSLLPENMPPMDKSTGNMLKQAMKSNPDIFLMMIKADPGLKNIIEKNPHLEAMLADPAIVDEMIEIMTDPDDMKDMQRQSDHLMGQLSDHPEAAAMYDRLMNQYYESVDKINDRHGVSHQEEVTEEEAQNPTLPNLWGSSPASTSSAGRTAGNNRSNPWSMPSASSMFGRRNQGTTQTQAQTSTENSRESPYSSSSLPFGGGSLDQGRNEMMYRLMEENPELLAAVSW